MDASGTGTVEDGDRPFLKLGDIWHLSALWYMVLVTTVAK
jgi:hypothetical protein